jgi:hypothetical protein
MKYVLVVAIIAVIALVWIKKSETVNNVIGTTAEPGSNLEKAKEFVQSKNFIYTLLIIGIIIVIIYYLKYRNKKPLDVDHDWDTVLRPLIMKMFAQPESEMFGIRLPIYYDENNVVKSDNIKFRDITNGQFDTKQNRLMFEFSTNGCDRNGTHLLDIRTNGLLERLKYDINVRWNRNAEDYFREHSDKKTPRGRLETPMERAIKQLQDEDPEEARKLIMQQQRDEISNLQRGEVASQNERASKWRYDNEEPEDRKGDYWYKR